jgi:hypothetical protein
MTINWSDFALVVITSLVAATFLVTMFSLALRLGDGNAPWRRWASIALYVVCALFVVFGIVLIVPVLRSAIFG